MPHSHLALLGLLLWLPCLPGCTPTRTPARPAGPPAAFTRYRVGDFVEYRYSGSFTPVPVVFREEVRAQEGNRLRIDIVVTRGAEERRWVQLLTDTPENQKNNVIDALYEWRDGRYVKLGGDLMREAFRLYSWTLLLPEGLATGVERKACRPVIAGAAFDCRCTTGKNTLKGRPIRFEDSTCPGFLWTHGPGRFWDEATGQDILRMTVGAHGRRTGVGARSMDPTTDPAARR